MTNMIKIPIIQLVYDIWVLVYGEAFVSKYYTPYSLVTYR